MLGKVSAETRQNAENEYMPVAVALNNAAVNAGPRVCCENTAITLPSTGNTASKPLQRSPTVLASIVTTRVNAAPAIIRQISLSDFGAGPLSTGCTVGNRYGDANNATAATATENGSDAGISDNPPRDDGPHR